ncbi:GmrSD restriction endonuclease domain-containing protein [Citrifermentans bremense]|uniref:GmrSD restriction endonuclease domain-containing protein n=1 Tax=Citrifermentans bremense TaxID=60035 RepID=UPI0003FB35CE|nr:DUF262 domain-containing protein [Citrifermentans bremense]
MSIMKQSSKALDRPLAEWFTAISLGQIKLPRFQRFEAWDRNRITSFLNTVVHNLPIGVTLVLEVGDEEKFVSRHIVTAEKDGNPKVSQHLLDGQQRLTAFWRSIHNNYEWETYFVHIPEFDVEGEKEEGEEISIRHCARYMKAGQRYPLWADEPRYCLYRGLIPVNLLRPADIQAEIDAWVSAATATYNPDDNDPEFASKIRKFMAIQEKVKGQIVSLRERIAHFNLPYLSLPVTTEKEVALQVFINMNTNSKPLSRYDIIVAEVESATGNSLHDLQEKLTADYPKVQNYYELPFQILATSALLQDKLPNERGMIDMCKTKMVDNWDTMSKCLGRMADFLDAQGVYDRQRLPTNAVLAVIAASYSLIPEHGDFRGKAEKLLQRYLWSAFFTDRYENSAASRAYNDFRNLRELLQNPAFEDSDLVKVPALNRSEHPLVTVEELMSADWPKRETIRGRGILSVANYLGAIDFADGQKANFQSLQNREYHHLFPDALLKEAEINSFLALNCALVTWKTNRTIGRKDPLDYLQDRTDWTDEQTVEQRLKTHLIPVACLKNGKYDSLEGNDRLAKIREDFQVFLSTRAQLVSLAVSRLANGESISPESLSQTSYLPPTVPDQPVMLFTVPAV